MIRIPHMTMAKVLLVLSALWILQGCAQVATQSHPVPVERLLEVESPPSVAPEAPAQAEPPGPVAPEAPSEVEPPGFVTPEGPDEVEPVPVKPEPLFYVHVVHWRGETLSLIAQWYTDSWHNWGEIEKANPGIDPRRITPGNKILIPASLLKERKPMPFDFLPPPLVSKKSASPLAARIPPKKRDQTPILGPAKTTGTSTALPGKIELFGPREAHAAPANIPEEIGLFGPGEITGRPATISEEPELFEPVD